MSWLATHWLVVLEWTAAVITAVSVYLAARENIWNWPTAIVSVAMYIVVYLRAGLYSDAGLQVFFLVMSVYGWYQWLYGGEAHSELAVSRASRRVWFWCAIIGVAFWCLDGIVMSRLKGVAFPYIDAATTTVSLIAQWMMTRKLLENWILWIVVNMVYVPVLLIKGLYPTAALYSVLLLLAIKGLVEWRATYMRGHAIAPHPAPTPA
ncbi:MAG TPA: nicotinamide riboside transporter PnuC [Gemmatimonadaceae bacterium]